ncbi:MAG: tetratricopeptide (TPR) repeat protein, partial [Paraglaciecola psychrophila]
RDKAIELYQGVITEDDESADSLQARNKLALLYLTGDQREQADALLAEIFTIEPENVEALITNAKLLINEKQYTVAIANLRTVLRSQPDSVEGLLLLGQAYEKDGSSSLALDNYRRLLALDPSNQEALYSSAKMAIAQDEQASAEQLLKTLLQKKPDHAEARRLLVSLLSKQQRWDEALNNVDVLLTNPTTLAAGYYLQGLVYSSQSDYPAAIESLQRALKEEPGIIEALSFLASAFTASNREKEGMDFLVNHVKNYPKHAHANELLGAYHHNNGRYAEALVSYRAAIALLPTRSSVYRRMGALHISQGQWQQAEETFQQGIDSIADNDGLYLLLAGVYSLTGDYQSARGVYESLLAERPGMQQVANNLAVILVDYMPSDENLRKALELTEPLRDSRSPAFLDTLGWVNFKLGNTSRALSLLETSVALGGNGPQYHYHLGMAYFRESQPEQARKHLEIAVSGNAEAYIGRDEAQLTLEAIRSAVPRG